MDYLSASFQHKKVEVEKKKKSILSLCFYTKPAQVSMYCKVRNAAKKTQICKYCKMGSQKLFYSTVKSICKVKMQLQTLIKKNKGGEVHTNVRFSSSIVF